MAASKIALMTIPPITAPAMYQFFRSWGKFDLEIITAATMPIMVGATWKANAITNSATGIMIQPKGVANIMTRSAASQPELLLLFCWVTTTLTLF